MRVRVPVAVRNRLLRIEARRPVNLPVGGWPSIMGLDAWEMLAARLQDELAALANEDIAPLPVVKVSEELPIVRKADDGLGGQRSRSGIEEYLEALGKKREVRVAHTQS